MALIAPKPQRQQGPKQGPKQGPEQRPKQGLNKGTLWTLQKPQPTADWQNCRKGAKRGKEGGTPRHVPILASLRSGLGRHSAVECKKKMPLGGLLIFGRGPLAP